MMKIKEVIVVEGRDDSVAIKRAVEADTIETNGSAIGETVLKRIELAQERRGVIIFTDPDYPGERIRKIVSQHVPGCKHAFIQKEEALSKNGNDLGVENASPEAIRKALAEVKQEMIEPVQAITWEDYVQAGLTSGEMARKRREKLGKKLNIGYANGKQLFKRLTMFQITEKEFVDKVKEILLEEQNE